MRRLGPKGANPSRGFRLRLTVLTLALQAVFLAVAVAAPGQHGPPARDQLIVGFRAGVTSAEQDRVLARLGAAKQRRFARIGAALASVPRGALAGAVRELERDPLVRYAEPNLPVRALDHGGTPNDAAFHELWGLHNFGQTVGFLAGKPDADIDAPEAWEVSTGSADVFVAVIDTGVDHGHPDLAANIWTNAGESCAGCRTNGLDDDGNGYVDDWRGWDFFGNDNDPMDDHGHGTHVAGTIGAIGGNGIGVVGVSRNVRLMPLKFLSADGDGTVADAVRAILYAVDQGVPISNNSWGGDEFSQALLDAIRAADGGGSLFVAAAGNSLSDNDLRPAYPASYEVPNVVSVAATDGADRRAWFSNYGRRSVDLGAPGSTIYSTWPGNDYAHLDGTSMAAPHVAGAAALAKAVFPAATAVGLKALLNRTADPVSALSSNTASGGRLNANTAVRCAGAPKVWLDSPAAGFEAVVGEPVDVSVIATRCADPTGATVTASANGAEIALTARGDGLYTGSYTPGAGGAVTVSATAAAGGSTDTRSVSGTAIHNLAIAPGGAPVTVTTSTPGEYAKLHFQGEAGRRVSVSIGDVTVGTSVCCSLRISIARPDGTSLVSGTWVGRNGGFLDTRVLPLSGRYTILFDPQGDDVGSATLTVHDVPPDPVAGIVPGGAPVTVEAGPVPGQNARLTFAGSAGRRVAVKVSGVTIGTSACCSVYVSILKPDGSTLPSPTLLGTNGGFVDTRTLPVGGTYTVLVDPQGAALGSATVTLYDVPDDVSKAIVPGGPAVSVSMGPVPGQNARLSFDGVAGRRVSLRVSGVTVGTSICCSLKVSILKPDGSTLVYPSSFGTSGGFVDTRSLPVSGVYSIVVDPQGTDLGGATLTLYDVPPDVTGPIGVGGPSVSVSLGPVPGQNARLTFSGGAGQRVSMRVSGVTIGSSSCCSAKLSILKPDGSTLVYPTSFGTNGGFLETSALPMTGTYAVLLDPQGTDVGSATLTLYDVTTDVTASLSVGGSPVSLSIGTPGQNARVTFAGAAGQRVTLRASSVSIGTSTCCSLKLSISKPDGTTLQSPTYVGTNGATFTPLLPVSGVYTILVDPQGASTGGLTFTLS